MNASITYFDKTLDILNRIRETQMGNIEQAAGICAESIANNGLVFLFGNGHSRMMCEEMTPRQGCFVGFVAMVELALSNHANIVGTNGLRAPLHLEKYEGYAGEILKGFKFGPLDAFIVAMGAKERGLPVIGICSREHCEKSVPAHSSGKKLIDVADVVIDNGCPPGDCVVELDGLDWRTGPTSTVTGGMIINMLRCRTAELLLEKGVKPVLLPSHQMVGNTSAQEQLERFYESYRRSLAHLYQ